MNSLKTLYFPGTAVPSLRLYPLFLLFRDLHFLAPVETDPAEGGESADSFINWGFCQVHTPSPLGTDRQRFLRLVADITAHGPDYTTQLSSLTLAAITERQPVETEREIVGSLLPPPAKTPEKEPPQRELLWQARLLLAIGELLDREEEEIALSLAMFEDHEKRLFQELQGEEDGEEIEALLGNLARLDMERRGNSWSNVKQRCQAWKTLYATMADGDFPLLLARTEESGDILRQEYERLSGREADTVITLPLPTVVGWSSDEAGLALQRDISGHRQTLAALFSYLVSLLRLDIAGGEQIAPLAAEVAEAWNGLLDREFPEERFGRTSLSFSLLSGWPISALLGHPDGQRSTSRNGLLITLR